VNDRRPAGAHLGLASLLDLQISPPNYAPLAGQALDASNLWT